ncbi:hypothetical protein [Kitasatospora sp. DSM 101779]|uniref:hypothetical protein n=1 Tax=Kitasatospora sp. DSM 101779 TaxID=2853165 RepID=UPI0021DB2B22|nr:hypothetical protein [Kitasatospora sp. DSM 101779]MCU7825731.1 hypothetical protein [Kitasatospora sp. DSM 101779]
MSDYSVLVAALVELSGERDLGIGAPVAVRGHEADRLASLARGSSEPPADRPAPLLRLLRRRTTGRLGLSV